MRSYLPLLFVCCAGILDRWRIDTAHAPSPYFLPCRGILAGDSLAELSRRRLLQEAGPFGPLSNPLVRTRIWNSFHCFSIRDSCRSIRYSLVCVWRSSKQYPVLSSLQFPAHVTPLQSFPFIIFFLQVTNQSQVWSGCCTMQASGTLTKIPLFDKSDI